MKKILIFAFIIILLFCGTHIILKDLFVSSACSLFTAFVFILYFIYKGTKDIFQRKMQVLIISLSVIALAGILLTNYNSYKNGVRQKEALLTVGGVIGLGELSMKMQEMGLNTIKEFYALKEKPEKNISTVFSSLYPVKKNNPDILDTLSNGSSGNKNYGFIYLDSLSSDKVIIIGQNFIYKGTNENFVNYGGQKGRVQAKLTITANGSNYEIQN